MTVPDELTISSFFGGGALPFITFAAPVDPSVVWVVTHVEVKVYCAVAGAGYVTIFQALDNGATVMGQLCIVSLDGTVVLANDSASWDGAFQSSPGNSLVVSANGASPAGIATVLTARATAR